MSNNTTSIDTSGTKIIVYICIHLVMPCAVAIGIIGNLLSILVFARREMIKFCVSIFTIVLALSDILLLTTSLFNIVLPDLGISSSDKSAFWCHFHGYFDLLFAAISGYSVVFISVERWFSVWKPFDKAKYVTFKTTLITVITYTTVSLCVFSWFPLALNYNPNRPKPGEICLLVKPMLYKIFGTFSVIFTYIVPFFSLGILNILIVYRLHNRPHTAIQRSVTSNSSTGGHQPSVTSASTRRRQKQRNTDRHITFMLITVAIAFMVMSFPYQIYWFYLQIRQSPPNKVLYTLTQTFRNLNCCCNVFLYSATSFLFRRQLQEIFQCTDSKDINPDVKTRARTLSSPPTVKNTDSAERKNLLSTTTRTQLSSSTKTTVENSNLTDPPNGHLVTFKT